MEFALELVVELVAQVVWAGAEWLFGRWLPLWILLLGAALLAAWYLAT